MTRASAAIAVTGIGVITPLADEPSALARALARGEQRIEDDHAGSACSRLVDFDFRRYASVRGMRIYPRNTQLQICAATRALAHAGVDLTKLDPCELGTVTASSYAHLETLLEYDYGLVSVGLQRTNPTLFPLSLPSAPGALTALSLGAKAFAITLSDGDGSGLAALGLAARLLAQGRAKVCVVTAAFTQCAELTLSASRAGLLTTQQGFRPFDRQSAGTVLGELAVALVLEPEESVRARGGQTLGYVRSQASTFAPESATTTNALVRACRSALAGSSIAAQQLSLVSSGASGHHESDQAEASALYEVLGEARAEVAVTASKSQLGESLDAGGLVQAATALLAMQAGIAPPISGLNAPSVPGLRYLTDPAQIRAEAALLTHISHSGACSALVLTGNHD